MIQKADQWNYLIAHNLQTIKLEELENIKYWTDFYCIRAYQVLVPFNSG